MENTSDRNGIDTDVFLKRAGYCVFNQYGD